VLSVQLLQGPRLLTICGVYVYSFGRNYTGASLGVLIPRVVKEVGTLGFSSRALRALLPLNKMLDGFGGALIT